MSGVACIDVPTPEPGPGEVLVSTQVSALCGSELKTYRDDGMETGNSGHEAAGIVTQLGPGVTQLQEGLPLDRRELSMRLFGSEESRREERSSGISP